MHPATNSLIKKTKSVFKMGLVVAWSIDIKEKNNFKKRKRNKIFFNKNYLKAKY